MKCLVAALVIVAATLLSSCGTPIVYAINKKEKVIERNAPPQPGFFVDKILYKRAAGRANVVWVVDNTWFSQALLFEELPDGSRAFRQGYERVAKNITNAAGNTRFTNFRENVILTPSNQMPGNFVSSELALENNFLDLFHLPIDRFDRHGLLISNADSKKGDLRDSGTPTPFESAALGLKHAAFQNRTDAATYFIFVETSRFTGALKTAVPEYIKSIAGAKPVASIDVFHLVPGPGAGRCGRAERPLDFLAASQRMGWNISGVEGNVCGDPNVWADQITRWIEQGQTEIRLSFMPAIPEQLVVATNARSLNFGTDFTYDARRNSILIKPGVHPALIDGEPVEIRYFQRITDPAGGK